MTHAAVGPKRRRDVIVLLSGGIDSSTCVAFYRRGRFHVMTLFIDYGQPAAEIERRSARAISRHYDVALHEVSVRGLQRRDVGYVPGRNAFLVCTALASAQSTSGLIALGIHAGTAYPDCSRAFVDACQTVADVYANGTIQVAAPFLEWSKSEIFAHAKKVGVPIDRTYSCEAGARKPCGKCLSCQDRASLR